MTDSTPLSPPQLAASWAAKAQRLFAVVESAEAHAPARLGARVADVRAEGERWKELAETLAASIDAHDRRWEVRGDWGLEVYDEASILVTKLPSGALPLGPVRPEDVARAVVAHAESLVLTEDQVLALAAPDAPAPAWRERATEGRVIRCVRCDLALGPGETNYCGSDCVCGGGVWCIVCVNAHTDTYLADRGEPDPDSEPNDTERLRTALEERHGKVCKSPEELWTAAADLAEASTEGHDAQRAAERTAALVYRQMTAGEPVDLRADVAGMSEGEFVAAMLSIGEGPAIPDIEPSSQLPWNADGSWTIVPSDETVNVSCADGCDGGCDDDPRDNMVQCRQLDHAGYVVCDVYGLEGFAQRDRDYIIAVANIFPELRRELIQRRAQAAVVSHARAGGSSILSIHPALKRWVKERAESSS